MNIVTKIIAKFDIYQRQHKAVGFPYAVLKKYGDDQAGHQAALLAYYGFLSIFPLLLVLTTVLRLAVRNDDHLRERIINGATMYFPIVGQDLQNSVHGLGGNGIIMIVGLVLTFLGARGVADVLRTSINHIWQVPHYRRSSFPHAILKSVLILLVGGAGLILAPLISSYAVSVGGHGLLMRLVALVVTVGILFGMFLALVRISLPNRIPSRELWPAAAIASIGLLILQLAGVYLVKHQVKHLSSLYGTFAIVLGLLYWLYLQAQVLMYAVETASVRALALWPRALDQQYLTPEDRKAFQLYARRSRFHKSEKIEVISQPPAEPPAHN